MYNENTMARRYTLKRRAESQAETRQRIVDAAVALHTELGPALTSLSRVAERAGVQRNTLYAHFPDERSLLMACSGQAIERDPLPDANAWREIRKTEQRLKTGLSAVYEWYERNAQLAGCVLRDAELNPLVGEIAALRYGPPMGLIEAVLGEGLATEQRAVLKLALAFATWRSLTRDSALAAEVAVGAMAKAIVRVSDT